MMMIYIHFMFIHIQLLLIAISRIWTKNKPRILIVDKKSLLDRCTVKIQKIYENTNENIRFSLMTIK